VDLLNIPKTIHIGVNKRNDTYTGHLAYVIYTDEKGKRRKECSWESWRDTSIDPIDYDNVPTSGFVLNKGVGGGRSGGGWNARNEYIRVYDPRNFEFEISVANLLFILQETNSIKGKGLEGEFVYSWSGADLVLLPVASAEYAASTEFTNAKTMKVTKKDMVEGCVYLSKDMRELVYLGRHKCRQYYGYSDTFGYNELTTPPEKFFHVFYDVETEKYDFERGFTKLCKKVSDESYHDYANLHTELVDSKYCSLLSKTILTPVTIDDMPPTIWRDCKFFIRRDDHYDMYQITNNHWKCSHNDNTPLNTVITLDGDTVTDIEFGSREVKPRHGGFNHGPSYKEHYIDHTKLVKMGDIEMFTIEYLLESGLTLGVQDYVQRQSN